MESLNKIISSFNTQKTLNPKMWADGGSKLNSSVRRNLLEIAYQFIDSFGLEVIIDDIIITGSIANYNWSKYSDIDLHIVVDYAQFPKELKDLYMEFFDLKKIVFNQKRELTMFGFDVEVYVEGADAEGVSGGVYSIMRDEWTSKPKKESMNKPNMKYVKEKAEQWMRVIDGVLNNIEDESPEEIRNLIKKYKDKLKKYRICGLQKGGEMSIENLVFKVLRRNGFIEKLYNVPIKVIDKKLSLRESTFAQPLENLEVSSPFGVVRPGLDTKVAHPGVDLRATSGTEVYAPADGVVVFSAIQAEPNMCGGTLSIKHDNGFRSTFCHLSSLEVRVGTKVKQGQLVALTGGGAGQIGKGFSTGPHLHYELRDSNENLVDPMNYLTGNFEKYEEGDEEESEEFDEIKNDIFDKKPELEENDDSEILEKSENSNFMKDFLKMSKSGINISEEDDVISNDIDVEKIQIALQFLDYLDPNYGIDGFYDEKTINAMNEFREDFDLSKSSKITSDDLLYMYHILLYSLFDDSKLSNINKEPNYDKLELTTINNFYQMVLIWLNVDITYNNINFLNAWNDATTIGGEQNPFGLPYMKEKNISSPILNTLEVLNSSQYSCVRFGLIQNKKISEILNCPIFDKDNLREKIKNFLHK